MRFSTSTSRPPANKSYRLLDLRGELIRALGASCLSGLLLGVAARVTMRFVAREAGVSANFSLGGSLEVVAFGTMIGAPVAMLFFGIRPRLPVRRPWPGLLWGLSLFGILTAAPPPAAQSALAATPDTSAATALAFGVLFVTWGLALEYLAPYALPKRPPPADV